MVLQGIVIPESSASCDSWRAYHTTLKQKFGKVNARTLWLKTWEFNGSVSCTTNADFNKWLKKNEIDVSSAATRAIADVSAIGGNILGFGKMATRLITIGVPVVLVFALLLLAYLSRGTTIKDVAGLHPGVR